MESQMVRPHGHTYEQATQDPHLAMGGEDEHHHEKKSVLKKVKAKAKKIKDTITKHGHGQNHDHDDHSHDGDHIPDDHDLYEEDDEDDEMIEDPEVHGTPIYESTAVMMGATPANTPMPSFSDHGVSDISPKETRDHDPSKTSVTGTESTKVHLEIPKGLEKDPHAPKDNPHMSYDPSNYQTKVTNPTGKGAEEIGITQILRSFDKMNVGDSTKSEPKSQIENVTNLGTSSTGSHDQFSTEPMPQHSDINAVKPTSYTEKISSATSAIAEKAVSAKNAVASKLGYGASDSTDSAGDDSAGGNKAASAKIAETLAPVYEKVAGAGAGVMSKVQGGGGAGSEGGVGQDRGVSVKDYLADKLRPAEEDKALSEAISDALGRREEAPATAAAPVERVTESEEVRRRLGEDSEVDKGTHNSYVDKVKGTVGSWLGFGSSSFDDSKASQGEEGDNMKEKIEERRLQESSN